MATDWGRLLAFRKQSFLTATGIRAPGAAAYANCQFQNPAASGVLCMIRSLSVSASAQVEILLSPSTGLIAAGTTSNGLNKYFSGPASKAVLNAKADAAVNDLMQAGFSMWDGFIAAGATFAIPFNEPLIIAPGEVFGFYPQAVNIGISVNVEWDEVTG